MPRTIDKIPAFDRNRWYLVEFGQDKKAREELIFRLDLNPRRSGLIDGFRYLGPSSRLGNCYFTITIQTGLRGEPLIYTPIRSAAKIFPDEGLGKITPIDID